MPANRAALSPDRRQLQNLLRWQLIVGASISAAALPFGRSAFISAIIGGGLCLLANGLFAAWVFRRYHAQRPGELLLRFYGAEIVKIVTVLVTFAAVFVTIKDLNPPVLIGAYFLAQTLPVFFAARPVADATLQKR